MYLDRATFMQKYVLARTSHKRKIEELLEEAAIAYKAIDTYTAPATLGLIQKGH